jgi:hypothetical protein
MCCGRQRQAMPAPPRQSAAPPAPPTRVVFEYVGVTALTVASPMTGKVYRFAHPGARADIDPRDRSWMSFVPNLARARQG